MSLRRNIDFIRTDYMLLSAVLFLVVLGLASVWSATSYRADAVFDDSGKYAREQAVRILIGLVLMMVFATRDYRFWLGWSPLAFGAGIVALLILVARVPYLTVTQNGSWGWMRLGPVVFQPSDFARYALILFLARMITKKKGKLDDLFPDYALVFGIAAATTALIALEHDMGGAFMTILVALLMLFFAQVPVSNLLLSTLSLASCAFAYVMVNPYMQKRLSEFSDEKKSGFQLLQSLTGLAQGGIFGQGIGDSHQKYNFLPMNHNDFIFSHIGEEYGLIGTVAVLVFFMIIIQRGIRIAQHAPDGYGRLLAGGVTACIGSYALVNAVVVTGMMPTTGIPMPFLSYGGTSMVTHFIGIGFLLNISSQADPAFAKAPMWQTYQERLNRVAYKAGSYMSRKVGSRTR
jgi:cell division protein FtsW